MVQAAAVETPLAAGWALLLALVRPPAAGGAHLLGSRSPPAANLQRRRLHAPQLFGVPRRRLLRPADSDGGSQRQVWHSAQTFHGFITPQTTNNPISYKRITTCTTEVTTA